MTPPLEPRGQCCSNFIWSLPGAGDERLLKRLQSIDQDGHYTHIIMVKTFENLLFQNWGCLVAESLHKSLGTGGLPKFLK